MTATHSHAIPPGYRNALAKAGGDPSGYPTWQAGEPGLDRIPVLSISTPGISVAGTGQQARSLCREANDYLADLLNKHRLRLDFFGALPDWRDVNGTLEEIYFIYSIQKRAVGVGLYTSYGDLPVWRRHVQANMGQTGKLRRLGLHAPRSHGRGALSHRRIPPPTHH